MTPRRSLASAPRRRSLLSARAVAVAALALPVLSGVLGAQDLPPTPPPSAPIRPAPFPPFQEAVLANGMRLVVVENHRQPVVSLSLSFPAGSRFDPVGKEGLADMTAGLLTKGAGTRSADQIASAIEGVGGSIGSGANRDFLTVRADVLTENAPLAFGLVADAVMRPTFPQREVDLARTQTLSGLQLQQSQPASLAARFFARGVYGETHPYGRRAGTESVKGITRDDLVAFQKAHLVPRGALLVVAGDLTLAAARRMADEAFKGWTGTPPAAPALPTPPARTKPEIVLVNRPGSVQSNVVIGNATFLPTDPRYYATVLANRILGGEASARLFRTLRDQKAWTYGSYSDISRPLGVGTFQATAEVRTEVTDSAVAEMLNQIRRMGTEPVPTAEFEAAKGALAGRFPLTIETAEQVAAAVTTAKLLGLPDDYLRLYRTRLGAVTPAAVQAASKGVFSADAPLIVVVGDGAKLRDKLARIAPVTMVSVEGKPITTADLQIKGGALDVDMSKLVARRDSFAILVQDRPFGWQRSVLEKTPTGYRYTEESVLGPVGQQKSEVTFTDKLVMQTTTQNATMQGQQGKIDIAYASGHAKGSATTPSPQGPKTVTVDTDLPPGTIDDNVITALVPALRWSPTAKFTIPVLVSGKGNVQQVTLAVTGTESVTVPAGTFQAYKVEMTGGEAPLTMWVDSAEGHSLLKIAPAGAPIAIVRAGK